eukprot:m.27989 g.27989  ORF g.27989 m.27989 type:complete len:469 (+) comp30524_c0_seq1:18-1424(+)
MEDFLREHLCDIFDRLVLNGELKNALLEAKLYDQESFQDLPLQPRIPALLQIFQNIVKNNKDEDIPHLWNVLTKVDQSNFLHTFHFMPRRLGYPLILITKQYLKDFHSLVNEMAAASLSKSEIALQCESFQTEGDLLQRHSLDMKECPPIRVCSSTIVEIFLADSFSDDLEKLLDSFASKLSFQRDWVDVLWPFVSTFPKSVICQLDGKAALILLKHLLEPGLKFVIKQLGITKIRVSQHNFDCTESPIPPNFYHVLQGSVSPGEKVHNRLVLNESEILRFCKDFNPESVISLKNEQRQQVNLELLTEKLNFTGLLGECKLLVQCLKNAEAINSHMSATMQSDFNYLKFGVYIIGLRIKETFLCLFWNCEPDGEGSNAAVLRVLLEQCETVIFLNDDDDLSQLSQELSPLGKGFVAPVSMADLQRDSHNEKFEFFPLNDVQFRPGKFHRSLFHEDSPMVKNFTLAQYH